MEARQLLDNGLEMASAEALEIFFNFNIFEQRDVLKELKKGIHMHDAIQAAMWYKYKKENNIKNTGTV